MGEAGGVAAEFLGKAMNMWAVGFQPALRAGPVDQLRAGQIQNAEIVR